MYTNKKELKNWRLEIQRRNIYDEILGYFGRTREKNSPSKSKSRINRLHLGNEINKGSLKSPSTNKYLENIETTESDFRLLDRGRSSTQVQPQNKLRMKTVDKDRVHYSSSKARNNDTDSAHGDVMQYSQRTEDEETRDDTEMLRNLMKELEELNVLEAEIKGQINIVSRRETTKRKNIYHKLFNGFEKRERQKKVTEESQSETNNLNKLHDPLDIDCEQPLQNSDIKLPIIKKDKDDPVVNSKGYLYHLESIQSFLDELPQCQVSLKTEVVNNELFPTRKEQKQLNTTCGELVQQFPSKRGNVLDLAELDERRIITFENENTKDKSIYKVSYSEFTKILEETNIPQDVKNNVNFLLKKHDFLDISVERPFRNRIKHSPGLSVHNEDLEKDEEENIQLKLIDLDLSDKSCTPDLQHCEQTKLPELSTINQSWRKSEMINNDLTFLDMTAISARYQSLYEVSRASEKSNPLHQTKDDLKRTELCPKIELDVIQKDSKKLATRRFQNNKNVIFSRVRHIHSFGKNTKKYSVRDSSIKFMERQLSSLDVDKEFQLSNSSSSESQESGDESCKDGNNLHNRYLQTKF